MRRIALLSDVHANLPALEAVLGDIDSSGIDEVYCLGDLVGYGSDPAGVIERIRRAGIPTIRGNYDDGVGRRKGSCGCYYATPEARAEGAESYARTDVALDESEHAYLAGLLDDVRFEAEGLRVLLCHGSPRRINEYLMPDRSDDHLAKLAEQAEADLVCVGHVHVPYHRTVRMQGDRVVHFVSDGSVGRPKDGDARACWAEVVLDAAAEPQRRVEVSFHRVEF